MQSRIVSPHCPGELPAQVQGRWFYLYLILDLYSRKVVGFEVHDSDSCHAHVGNTGATSNRLVFTPRSFS